MASPTKTAQNVWQTNGGEDFLQLKSSTGTVEAGIDSTGAPFGNLSPAPIPSGQVLNSDIEIPAAQIATWSSQSIQLLPAPGVGKFIDVIAVALSYTAGQLIGSNISGTNDLVITNPGGPDIAVGSSSALDQGTGIIPFPYPNNQNNYLKLAVPVGTNNTIFEVPYPSYLAANQPLQLTGGADADGTGGIGANHLGSGGLLYAVGDAFSVSDADSIAFGYVDTVDGITGAVLTYHLVNVGANISPGSLPDTSATTALSGSIIAATVTSGNAGIGYAAGDLFLVTTGDSTAWCEVDTIGAGGSVATFHIVWGGSTYSTGTGNATQVLSGHGDGNLQIDIGTIKNSNGSGLTIVITSLYLPDGAIKVGLIYVIRNL